MAMDFSNKKMLILTRKEYFPLLFSMKESDPSLNFKVMAKSEFLDLAEYTFAKDPIPFLMKEGISYSKAKKYIALLRIRERGRDPFLDDLERRLDEKGYLQRDPYGEKEIESLDVKIFRIEQDEELLGFLKRKNIPYSSFEMPEYVTRRDLNFAPEILLFQNKFAQYMYIFSDIRKKVKADPNAASRMQILIKDETDAMYISLIAPRFGIPFHSRKKRPLITYPSIKKVLSAIYEMKSFYNIPQGEGEEQEFWHLVDFYELRTMPFDLAYANLLEILQANCLIEEEDVIGVEIVTSFLIDPKKEVYVVDFAYGSFYKEFSDKNVYSDEDLRSFCCNPSYVNTLLDRQVKLDYITFTPLLFLSRVKEHLQDSIYPSQFIAELGWDKECEKLVDGNADGLFTSEAALLSTSDFFDKTFNFAKIGDIRSYDHSFKGIGFFPLSTNKPWSVTNLEGYISCPFRYLMGILLPEKDADDYYKRVFGSAVHKIMESIYHPDFSFDEAVEAGVASFREYKEKLGSHLDERDEALLEVAKHWLALIVHLHRRWLENGSFLPHSQDAEIKISFHIDDDEGNRYPFSGRIDKVVWTKSESLTYYTIVDYKTGSETFDPLEVFLGKSTQLPIYHYAIEQNAKPEFSACLLGGFGLAHVYAKTIAKAFVKDGVFTSDALLSISRLDGLVRDEEDYWSSIDRTAFKPKGGIDNHGGRYVRRHYCFHTDEAYSLLSNPYRPYTLEDMVDDAKKGLVTTIKKIESGRFPIAPAFLSLKAKQGMRVCSFCKYRDVCYRNLATDGADYWQEIQKHFAPNDEEKQP